LTEHECQTLTELGAQSGYERSEDVGERLFDGTFAGVQRSGRTSTNAWCMEDCYTNTTTQNVLNKIVNLTSIPDVYWEYLQLFIYDFGQFYEQHHDYIDHDRDRHQGVREFRCIFIFE
jgi:prolyl 4-hydroxylase